MSGSRRVYHHDVELISVLSEASGVSETTIKSDAVLLAKMVGLESVLKK